MYVCITLYIHTQIKVPKSVVKFAIAFFNLSPYLWHIYIHVCVTDISDVVSCSCRIIMLSLTFINPNLQDTFTDKEVWGTKARIQAYIYYYYYY